MNLKLIAMALAITFFYGCSGGGDAKLSDTSTTDEFQNNGNTSNAKIIDKEDLTTGLKGIDANKNGIRDDVDRLIALKYSVTPAMKKAAEQKARTLQKALEVSNLEEARLVGNEIMRAWDCVELAIPDEDTRSRLSREVEALTANTKERFAAYWKGEELSGGMVFSQPDPLYCD
jgi:hypothetical protein